MRVWHQRILEPAVFHALVARVEVHVALAPDRFMGRALLAPVVVLAWVARLVTLLLWQPLLLPVVPSLTLETVCVLGVMALLLQVGGRHRLSPTAPEVVEMLRVVWAATVLVVLPVVRVSWVLLFVLHAVSL